jgi:endonuclease/exonuclease/phosphatase family metal-dependent hydrolase
MKSSPAVPAVYRRAASSLPPIGRPRLSHLELNPDGKSHDELFQSVPEINVIELSNRFRQQTRDRFLNVVVWNAERGTFVLENPSVLERHKELCDADVIVLNEMDVGMARTQNRHTVREIADRLRMNYAYAVEFFELTKGEPEERNAPGENESGFHGNAILSKHEIRDPHLLRLEGLGQWFDDEQKRIGSRIALIATIDVSGFPVRIVNTHLESAAQPDTRARQMRQVLSYLEAASDEATIIGGDFNTSTIDQSKAEEKQALAAGQDPLARLLKPMQYEPLFADLKSHGYEVEAWNDLSRGTALVLEYNVEARLDWIVGKGLSIDGQPSVIRLGDSEELGRRLSDHHLLRVRLELPK